jgi:hypothetical protein
MVVIRFLVVLELPIQIGLDCDCFAINVPAVYMAQGVMILMRANPLQGPLEGVGPENRDFCGP